jgi:hypothetical protein
MVSSGNGGRSVSLAEKCCCLIFLSDFDEIMVVSTNYFFCYVEVSYHLFAFLLHSIVIKVKTWMFWSYIEGRCRSRHL